MSRIVSGTLYVESFVSTGSPGEYTFTDAIYENQSDPTGAGSLAITPGYILFVNAIDPNTASPLPGVVIRFKITQVIAADGLHLSAKILWDDEYTQDDEPQNASFALISEPTVYHQFGLPESEIVYPNLQGGTYENAIVKDIRHITDKLGFTGVGVTGMPGTSGTTGFQGLTGVQGYTGLVNWLTESYYPTGALAIPLLLWNLNDNALFAYVTGMDAWVQISAGSLQGATGAIGLTGDQGLTGIQGVTGVAGNTGIQGVTGIPGTAAAGIIYYLHEEPPGITGLESLRRIPGNDPEVHYSAAVDDSLGVTGALLGTTGILVLHGYITETNDPGITLIPAGVWNFNTYLKTDDITGGTISTYRVELLKRTISDIYTSLFTLNGSVITNTVSPQLYSENYVQQTDIPLDLTDRLEVRYWAVQNANATSRVISLYYEGSQNASHLKTPIFAGPAGPVGPIGPQGYTGIQGVTGDVGSLLGNQIPMGLPIDGSFSGGIFDWDATTKVTSGLDDLNELLLAIAPSPPGALAGALTLSGTTKYSAIFPTGLNAVWYQDGAVPGGSTTDYVVDGSYSLASANQSTTFKVGSTFAGDEGTVYHVEDGVDGSSRAITAGVGVSGTVNITSVATYNTIWRKGNAQIDYTQTAEGYKKHAMRYQTVSVNQITSDSKFYYDDVNATPVVSTPTVSQNTLGSSRYLSGIRYYYIGDTFDFSGTVTNIANKSIRPTNPISYSMNGLSTVNVAIGGATFAWNGIYTFNPTGVALNASNVYSLNSRLTLTATKPSGTAASGTSSTQNRFVNTYSTTNSSNGDLTMFDENYRFPTSTDFSVIPGSITGNWTSSTALSTGNAQLYDSTWYYPSINFTSGYLPAQGGGTNYSSFSGDQVVVWGQNIGVAHSSMRIVFTGIVYTDISPVGSGSLNLEIRLPTATGWLDAGRDYGDGAGCRLGSSSGSTLNLTFGTASSSTSSGVVFIRVTLRTSSAARASRMVVSGL